MAHSWAGVPALPTGGECVNGYLRFNRSVVERHVRELELVGRTEFRLNSVRLVLLLIGALVFSGFGLLMMWIASGSGGATTEGSAIASFVFGAVTLGFFGVLGLPAILLQWLLRRRLVVSRQGFWVERRTRGGPTIDLPVYWFQVSDFGFRRVGGRWPFHGTPVLICTLTQEADQHVRNSSSGMVGVLRRLDAAILGPGQYVLPSEFGRRPGDVLEVLRYAHVAFRQRRM